MVKDICCLKYRQLRNFFPSLEDEVTDLMESDLCKAIK